MVISQFSIERYRKRYIKINYPTSTKPFFEDKLLESRERETLLIIIAALAVEAKINYTKTSKASDLIET